MEAAKLMGYETPGDKKVPVTVRDWGAMKLALWRSKGFSEIVVREATKILDDCRHADGCPGTENETAPCLTTTYTKTEDSESELLTEGCPDREQRMSALVILNAARQLAPEDARRPADEPFIAPSREYYSEVMATLGVAQVENEMLRALLRDAGIAIPEPVATSEPAQLAPAEETP